MNFIPVSTILYVGALLAGMLLVVGIVAFGLWIELTSKEKKP